MKLVNRGDPVELKLIFQAATWLLTLAFFSGLAMAIILFGTDKRAPFWIAKLHGYAATAAITLLIFGQLNIGLSRFGLYGLLTLLFAASGGLVLNLGFSWRQQPLPQWLVFVHMSVAFVGFLMVGLAGLSTTL